MSRRFGTLAGVVVVLLSIGGPAVFAVRMQTKTRNFRVVRDGVLYRSGQTTLFGLKNLLHEYHIRTVVSLRDGDPPPDQAEEDYCRAEEVKYVRIPPGHWDPDEGPPLVDRGVETFRELIRDPDNYPVLVHCFAGIHRTGAYCAIYRMEMEHWSNARAMDEMMACGYYNLPNEGDILGYLRTYRPTWQAPLEAEANPAGR